MFGVSFEQKQQARKQFMQWLSRAHPGIASSAYGYDVSVAGLADWGVPTFSAPDTRTEYVTTSTAPVRAVSTQKNTATPAQVTSAENWWQAAVRNITEAAPQLIATKAQYDLMKTNIRRAEAGQAPIDSAQFAPTVRVQGEISSADKSQLTSVVLMGAGIIGAALLLPALLKR